jgi:hypothetical protein
MKDQSGLPKKEGDDSQKDKGKGVSDSDPMVKQTKPAATVEELESSKQAEIRGALVARCRIASGAKLKAMQLRCVMHPCTAIFVCLMIMLDSDVPNSRLLNLLQFRVVMSWKGLASFMFHSSFHISSVANLGSH